MKKILMISLLILSGCSKKAEFTSVEWQRGDPLRPLKPLQSLEYSSAPALSSLEQKVALREQRISGIPIEGSFIKNLKNSENQDVLIRASVVIDGLAQKLKLEEFLKGHSSVSKSLRAKYPALHRNPPEKIEVVLVEQEDGFHPLWKVLYLDSKGVLWNAYFDQNERFLFVKKAGSQFHDTVAWVYPKGPKKSVLQEVNLTELKVQPTLSNARVFVGSQADLKIASVSQPLKFGTQDPRFDQVQVFYFLNESLNWFENKLNFKIGYQLQAEVHVGSPEKTNSAFYYQGKIRLGQGDDEVYARIPHDASIVIHESVHAVIDSIARLPFEGEGGSLNEGFADFFTAVQLGSPHMGEVAYLKGPFRRTLLNDLKVSDKSGGLYHDSGIVSGLLWELSTQFGMEKGMRIGMLTLNRLVPSSNFEDFGKNLRAVLPDVLSSEADRSLAREIILKREF